MASPGALHPWCALSMHFGGEPIAEAIGQEGLFFHKLIATVAQRLTQSHSLWACMRGDCWPGKPCEQYQTNTPVLALVLLAGHGP